MGQDITTPRVLGKSHIEEWLDQSGGGWFTYDDIYRDLTVYDNTNKDTIRKTIRRMVDEGKLKQHPDIKRKFRLVKADSSILNWQKADLQGFLNLRWPFELEKLVKIFPGNVVVIGGTKDGGKTAFCLDFTVKNMREHDIVYFTSELGEEELAERLGYYVELDPEDWHFEARALTGHPADCIQPDKINIIDFLEISDSFFQVAGIIREIYDRLTTGIAIICIQKDANAKFARGGAFSSEKARLYVTLDAGNGGDKPDKMTIVVAKNRMNSQVNPRGKVWTFKLVNGCRFVDAHEVIDPWPGD